MKRPQRPQLIAAVGTLAFHLLVVVALLMLYLRFNPADLTSREWPPVDSAEILFGGEYVVLGENPQEVPAEEPSIEPVEEPATPVVDAASTEVPSAATTTASAVPSPAKVEKPKPEKEQLTPKKPVVDPAAQKQQERQQATSTATNSRVSGAFANSKSNSKPTGGAPDGNARTGNTSGQPGANVGGRTLAKWVKASGNAEGTITIDVTVNRQGNVTRATYNPAKSSGAVAASTAARNSCISAAKQCTFSVATEGPESQRGTISFKFR